MLTAKIENGFLVVKIPLQEPTVSKSGKTLVVASSHGNVACESAKVGGKVVTIGLNAYISK